MHRLFQLIFIAGPSFSNAAPSLAGRSVYFVVTDRFARNDTNRTACGGSGQWCGGSFRGLMSQLDYIQGMGFDCVWITPVVTQISGISCNNGGYCGTGYHGYWAEDWWTIDPHLGSSDDLVSLSTELHARSVCCRGSMPGPLGFRLPVPVPISANPEVPGSRPATTDVPSARRRGEPRAPATLRCQRLGR